MKLARRLAVVGLFIAVFCLFAVMMSAAWGIRTLQSDGSVRRGIAGVEIFHATRKGNTTTLNPGPGAAFILFGAPCVGFCAGWQIKRRAGRGQESPAVTE